MYSRKEVKDGKGSICHSLHAKIHKNFLFVVTVLEKKICFDCKWQLLNMWNRTVYSKPCHLIQRSEELENPCLC